MNSLDILEFSNSLKAYIESKDFPLIVKQMIVVEVANDLVKKTDEEIKALVSEREGNNGIQ